MKDNTDYMDKAIKEKFEGHEVPVPSHLWNSIESNLPPEPNNTEGNFFFKNPFILSILFISTVLVGTYLYYSSNAKTNDSISTFNITNTSDAKLNSNSTVKSNSISDNVSLTGKYQASIASSKNGLSIKNEDKNSTSNCSVSIDSEVRANVHYSKNKANNNTNNSKNTEGFSATAANTYSSQNQNRNLHIAKQNNQVHNTDNSNSATLNQSNKTDLAHLSSNKTFEKEKKNSNTHSSSIDHTIKSTIPESTNTTSTSLAGPINTATAPKTTSQTANTSSSKNSGRATAYTDSTIQYASASDQESDSFNQIKNGDTKITSDKTTLIDNTKTDNAKSSSVSNQDLQAVNISSKTAISSSTSNLTIPSEITSVYNQEIQNNETTERESASTNKYLASNTYTNTVQTSITGSSLDSIHNNTPFKNSAPANSSIENDATRVKNNSTEEVLLKIDSTTTEHPDTNSIAKEAETIEIKSNETETNKKNLFLSRCSFDGYATPTMGYIHLYPNSNEEGVSENTKERNKNAQTGFGFTTGLRANYALTQKIEIGIGFQYSSLSQQSTLNQQHLDSSYTTYQGYNRIDSTYDAIGDTTIYTSQYVITDSATTDVISTSVKSYTDKFQNFSIPIHIAYGYSISNKLSLLARTSLLINYQTSSTTYLNTSDSTIIGYHSNKNLSLGGSFSIGCYYQFAKRYSVFAEPIITYYFSNVFDKQVPFKQTQLMFGLQTGVRLSF